MMFPIQTKMVASFTDAWIETFCAAMARFWRLVASFTDAWIETVMQYVNGPFTPVASFTDAWIETKPDIFIALSEESHLLQMRGLKHQFC